MSDTDRLIVSVSGVRGVIGKTLTPQVATEFGLAFGAMLGAGRAVVIARDSRVSGPMLKNAVTAGLLASGINVVDLGMVTTPGAALMTRKLGSAGGVIITASHNPVEYNGIKFLQPTGTALPAQQAERLKDIWQSRRFAPADALGQGTESQNNSTHAEHIEAVCDQVDERAIAKRRFKVVLDSINGAGCIVTPMLLERLGCEVVHLNSEPTGRFAHTPEPVAENLEGLCQAVRDHRADVGFAQDPDADRLALVDQAGRYIGEEYTLALSAAFVLTRRKGRLATNLVTSRMIDDIAAAAGVEVVRAPTGEANVVEMMNRQACIFGGEGGGGVIEPLVVPVRNSLVAIAYTLQYLTDTGATLSGLVERIPSYVMLKTKFPCPADSALEVIRAAREAFKSDQGAKFNDADGLRIDLPCAWLAVRSSNTEPIMRIIAEADNEQTVKGLFERVRQAARGVVKNIYI